MVDVPYDAVLVFVILLDFVCVGCGFSCGWGYLCCCFDLLFCFIRVCYYGDTLLASNLCECIAM